MFNKDNLKWGLTIGLIAPLFAIFLYYAITLSSKINFQEFIYYLRTNKSLLTGVSSVCLIANAVFFTIFINRRLDKTAKGIFISTLLYGSVVLAIKFLA